MVRFQIPFLGGKKQSIGVPGKPPGIFVTHLPPTEPFGGSPSLGPVVRQNVPPIPSGSPLFPPPFLPSEPDAVSSYDGPRSNIREPAADSVIKLITSIHKKYLWFSRVNVCLYYATRFIAGLCSALVPFVVNQQPSVATVLAITVTISIVIDAVFKPGERWQLYSKATDLLTIAEIKLAGNYDKYKELLDIIVSTESVKLARLADLKEILERVKSESNR